MNLAESFQQTIAIRESRPPDLSLQKLGEAVDPGERRLEVVRHRGHEGVPRGEGLGQLAVALG